MKQIKTSLEGNRQIYLPREIQDRLPKSFFLLTEAHPSSIQIFGEAILYLKGQIDRLLPEGPVIICFIIPLFYLKEKMIIFYWKLFRSAMV